MRRSHHIYGSASRPRTRHGLVFSFFALHRGLMAGIIISVHILPTSPDGGGGMATEDDAGGSVTFWIEGLKTGDAAAVQELWRRYFESLVRLAHAALRASPRTAEDEEDAAL